MSLQDSGYQMKGFFQTQDTQSRMVINKSFSTWAAGSIRQRPRAGEFQEDASGLEAEGGREPWRIQRQEHGLVGEQKEGHWRRIEKREEEEVPPRHLSNEDRRKQEWGRQEETPCGERGSVLGMCFGWARETQKRRCHTGKQTWGAGQISWVSERSRFWDWDWSQPCMMVKAGRRG